MTLKEASEILAKAGIESAREEARALFSHFEKTPSYKLITENPKAENPETVRAVERRAEREPLQYIIGEVGFFRETYKVTPDCLIPREDTEILVDFAVKNLPRGARFADLCTGSGCIAISVLKNTEETEAYAADISDGALSLARENAKANGVEKRIAFEKVDLLSVCPKQDLPFDAIISNPPYVTNSAYTQLEKEIYKEPKCAFLGGEDGGDFYRAITKNYPHLLSENGFFAYEIGYDQAELIRSIAKQNGFSAEIIADLSGNPRVAVLRREK